MHNFYYNLQADGLVNKTMSLTAIHDLSAPNHSVLITNQFLPPPLKYTWINLPKVTHHSPNVFKLTNYSLILP